MSRLRTEKRRYPRLPFRHDAILVVSGYTPLVVTIENICEGGALVSGVQSERLVQALETPENVSLSLHVFLGRPGQAEQGVRLGGRCVRVRNTGTGLSLGIAFHKPFKGLVEHARAMGGQGQSLSAARREQLEQQCHDIARECFVTLVQGLADEIKVRLKDRLERAESFQAINALRDTQVVVLEHQAAFSKALLQRFQAGLDRLYSGASEAPRSGELEVVDKAVFEQWLELQMIGSAVANRFREPLFRLHQALSAVFQTHVDGTNNPLGPRLLCEALQQVYTCMPALKVIEDDLPGAFEQVMLEYLPAVYRRVLDEVSEAGIRTISEADQLPVRPMAIPVRQVRVPVAPDKEASGKGEPRNVGEAESPVTEAVASPPSPGRQVVQTLLRLVEAVSGDTQARTGASPETPDDLSRLAQVLQEARQAAGASVGDEPESIQAHLDSLAASRPEIGHQVGPVARNLAVIVDRLFTVLTETSGVDGLVNRLRLPLFEMILEDMDFLEDREHPVRRLLDDMASLMSTDQPASVALRRTLEPIVEALSRGRYKDRAFVQDALERVHRLVERQEKAFLRNAERIARTHAGREKLERARKAVRHRLDAMLREQQVPKVILELLDAGWEQVMVLVVLKEGADSATCMEHFNTLTQLMDWLRLDETEADALFSRDLELPAVLEMLEREMVATGEPARVRKALRSLKDVFDNPSAVEMIWVPRYPLQEEKDKPGGERSNVIHVAPERWRRRAHELAVGDWVEIELRPGKLQRMRLVWVSESSYKFVFLTQNGLQEVEIPLDEMARQLAEGRARKTDHDSVSLVDRGLYDAIQTLYARMASQATHDPLTGCIQRREFEKHLERVLLLTKHAGSESALIVFDVDQFALINSQYGTGTGDTLLREIPHALDRQLDSHAGEMLLGRTGSNEFALLLYPCSREQAMDVAAQVVKTIAGMDVVAGHTLRVSASAGVVVIDTSSPDAGTLMAQASSACNVRKRDGGNGWQLYVEDDARVMKESVMMRWAKRLDQPFDAGDLVLTGQLIRNLRRGDRVSCEILLQARDEQGQPCSPAPLIEAAERFNRIVQLDRWIVEGVLDWMKRSPAVLEGLDHLNVNLSGHSLSDDGFLEWLDRILLAHPRQAMQLCFEVTETAAVSRIHYTADFMHHVRKKGVRFALDDFGTGLSSYAYLQQLPVDYLKVDGIFVKDIDTNLTHYAMVKSINELGHFMGMETVAEFVENPAIAESLRELGVDWAQGYLYSRPAPLDTLDAALRAALRN